MEYTVTWSVDVEADSPEEAAELGFEHLDRLQTTITFDVTEFDIKKLETGAPAVTKKLRVAYESGKATPVE